MHHFVRFLERVHFLRSRRKKRIKLIDERRNEYRVPTFLRIAINIACFRATFFLYFHSFMKNSTLDENYTLFARCAKMEGYLTMIVKKISRNVPRVRRKIIGRDDDETGRPILASIHELTKQRGETFPLFPTVLKCSRCVRS